MLKYFILTCLAATLATSLAFTATPAYATPLEILFQHTTEYQPSRGVTHQTQRLVTPNGMLDIHVLKVDMDAPYIDIAPVISTGDLGRKETSTNLLQNAGAVAGINADFFGLAGAYSTHFGPMAHNGVLLAANTYANYHRNQFATMFLDTHGNTFFNYMRSTLRFYANGHNHFSINTYNSLGNNLDWPMVVSPSAMADTSQLTERFDNLVKIVVDGNSIIYISEMNETVDIPQWGYVVVVPEAFHYRLPRLAVGNLTRLVRGNNLNIDFRGIQMAIGGGALLLEDGEVTSPRGVAPNARHPRSAVGVNRDGNQLILVAVDGRSHSIGATHGEMGEIMRRLGAYNAMHFDGGGSTTMVSSDRGTGHYVTNTVSDGAQRRVINALGVFDHAPVGDKTTITLTMASTLVGAPVSAQVYGEDVFWNRIPIDIEETTLSILEGQGSWEGLTYTPTTPGRHVLQAQYGDYTATATIYAYELAQILPNISQVNLFTGGRANLRFNGVSTNGTTLPLAQLESLTVSPSNLGHFVDNTFVATGTGGGYISASLNGVQAFIPVTIPGSPRELAFTTASPLSVPANTTTRVTQTGNNIALAYTFVESSNTQAAYASFYPALEIPGTPAGLSLQVYGDGSGHWLRGRVQDAEGRNHLIDFTHNADFYGWQTLHARMPNAPAPFTLDQIYMVATSAYQTTTHHVQFANLTALYNPLVAPVVPTSTPFVDAHRASANFEGFTNGHRTTIAMPEYFSYSAVTQGDVAVITLTAYEGSIFAADQSQWQRFARDIERLNRQHVVILMDYNPLNLHQSMEFELLHLALTAQRRNVLVVSPTGQTLTVRDGIRYIGIAQDEITIWTAGDQFAWR